MSVDASPSAPRTPPPATVVEIESAPDSDATMLQALDAAAAAAAAGEQGDEWADEGFGGIEVPLNSVDEFEKTLQSDVNENQALLLLCDVQACDDVFAAYTDDDMERLARYLSVLSFDAGERLISKGEPSSFCGIVLSGCFHAVVSDTMTIPLVKGSVVGEMSYFEGGKRTADIVSAEPSVLAVISFNDIKKLQPFEAELVSKFLHMLAVVSIRKLRNMMAKPVHRASVMLAVPPQIATLPAADKKEESTLVVPQTLAAVSEASSAEAAPATASPPVEKDNAHGQESLFKQRLKKKAAALAASNDQATLEEARRRAEAAFKSKQAAQKKGQEAQERAGTLEAKLRDVRAQANREIEDARLEVVRAKETATKADKRSKTLTEELAMVTLARSVVTKELELLIPKHEALRLEREELSRGTSLLISQLEAKLDVANKSSVQLRGLLDAESSRVKLLTKSYDEAHTSQESLTTEHRTAVRELDTTRSSLMTLQDKVAHLEARGKDLITRLNDEELAHVSWKSKYDLVLGDYTRLTTRVRDMELTALEATRDRRLTLRKVAQLRALIKNIIVRSFVRNVRTRKQIFSIIKRVNQVVASRIDKAEASALGGSGGTTEAGAPDDLFALEGSQTQTVSAVQARKDRAKLLAFLRADRTCVGKLIWLLDDELSSFESPFHALQTENSQLRHTLDAFFKRNIQLCQQFMQAKQTYEALHREYARLREAYEQLKRKEKAEASVAATAGAMMGGGTSRPLGGSAQSAIIDDDEDGEAMPPVGAFASSLTMPSPTPLGASALTPLSGGQLASYSAAFLPPTVNTSSSGRATPATPTPLSARKARHASFQGPSSQMPTQSHLAHSRSPRPPPAQAPLTLPSRLASPRAPPTARPNTVGGLTSPSPTAGPSASFGRPTTTAGSPATLSYDITPRPLGTDVASRSEALRHQITASIHSPRNAPTHPHGYGHAWFAPPSPSHGWATAQQRPQLPVPLNVPAYSTPAPVGPGAAYPHVFAMQVHASGQPASAGPSRSPVSSPRANWRPPSSEEKQPHAVQWAERT